MVEAAPGAPVNILEEAKAFSEAQGRYRRACRDLFWLGSTILHYEYLTRSKKEEEYHRSNLAWLDAQKAAARPFTLFMGERGGLKTTYQIIDAAQDILIDPNATILFCHAVDDEIQKVVQELGNHFLKNDDFRRVRPEIMPSKLAKRFLSASQFTVKRKAYDRQPTVLGRGAGAEITGAHVKTSIRLDDIIGRQDIEDNQLPKKKSWYRNTILPVRMPGCRIIATGTHWDISDPYMDWRGSKIWDCRVRHARETDGKLDYKGKAVLKSEAELKLLESGSEDGGMGPDFALQMMNDPSPPGEKPWDKEKCEHMVTLKELGLSRKDFKIVMSDPAPAKVGSFFEEAKKLDGSKNEWATVTVAVRKNGQREELILLDGSASKEWEPEAGWTEVCRQKRRWDTPYCSIEQTGQAVAFYSQDIEKVSRREGVRHSPIDLTLTYKGKNQYFAKLAEKARQGEFLIADSVPEEFLEGFLYQCREWRPMPGGKNSLKLDDRANVVSFGCDPCFSRYARSILPERDDSLSPYRRQEEPEYGGTRHVAW